MIINCHKFNLGILKKQLGTQTIYLKMTLHVCITFRVDSSPKVI